jgi:Fic family protein
MQWNWQKDLWPNFHWDDQALQDLETQYIHQSGILLGSTRYLNPKEEKQLQVEMITGEAMKTSEIEGEYLNRNSVQASIMQIFGFKTDKRQVEPAEQGIAEMLTDLYMNFSKPLSNTILFDWHSRLTNGRRDLKDLGRYRTSTIPMRVISGRTENPIIHFEAPPSNMLEQEMKTFLNWFKKTDPNGEEPLPALTRAGIAHLYFECIHPFEDGNGRIGRAIAEKALSQSLGKPSLIALSQTIERNRKEYYKALAENNKDLEITAWLTYFAQTILEAQKYSLDLIDFLIAKTKFFDRFRGNLNPRQEKVLSRMFKEGLDGFKGGLSAENYISIAGSSRATTTRDLQDLVKKGALRKTGELKSTRYYLEI